MARARRSPSRKTLFDLPPLELDCMKALWAQGEATVREIREQLLAGGRSLAYTTVETIMDRLARKGAVARRKVGRAHRYTPVYQAAEARARAVRSMAEHFFGGDRRALASYLSGREESPTPSRPAPPVRRVEESGSRRVERPTTPRPAPAKPAPSPAPPPATTERPLDTSLL
ncbi:MAG TPA: BlaI/MecI/CopY family transcriptional regulator [Candidatus Xenobia bacterium]|nr:BlaI/MecI/CopY family transcriptional regulator [Candidatus Xenobia bacterium]